MNRKAWRVRCVGVGLALGTITTALILGAIWTVDRAQSDKLASTASVFGILALIAFGAAGFLAIE